LTAPYDSSAGDVTIRITNTLDQGTSDESIGYGELQLKYEFDDGHRPLIGDYDEGVNDPASLWENNCAATPQMCQGHKFYGGYGQCAKGH
jgi:hypothetical protein